MIAVRVLRRTIFDEANNSRPTVDTQALGIDFTFVLVFVMKNAIKNCRRTG